MRRIGYGYERQERDFAHAGCDLVYIDSEKTNRCERTELFRLGLRDGDTLVLLARGDLGKGRQVTGFIQEAERRGAAVRVAKRPPERPAHRPRGFEPPENEDAEILAMWKNPVMHTTQSAINRAERANGGPVSRGQMYYRYGGRWER
jgi:hypothetical protein